MRRTLFTALLAALTLVSVLTGCGKSGSGSSAGASDLSSGGTSASTSAAGSSSSSGSSSGSSTDGWAPDGSVTFLAPAAPGSGYDCTARALAGLFRDTGLVRASIQVENVSGGAGKDGFTSFAHHDSGDGSALIAASASSITIPAANGWEVSLEDFTPIAKLATDAFTMAVPADSTGLDTLDAITARLQEDPLSVRIGIAGLPDPDYIGMVLYLQEIGVDPADVTFVQYDGGGEQLSALLDGQIDIAASSLSEFSSAVGAGEVRAIGVATEERMGGSYADTPTFREQGIDLVYGNWRGFWGPKDMPEEMLTYWQDVARAAVETDAWKELCESMQWVSEPVIDGCGEWTARFREDCIAALQGAGIL